MDEFRLKNPYITVQYKNMASFGGSQEWLKTKTLQGYGCGLIGAADLLLYLQGRQNLKSGSFSRFSLSAEDYLSYIQTLRRRFPILPRLGVNGWFLAWGIRRSLRKMGIPCQVRWGTGKQDPLTAIKTMLSADLPVLLSIGPNFPALWGKQGVPLYRKTSRGTFAKSQDIRSHYVVVTALEGTMLQLSSWGKEYYLNWEEYQNYTTTHSCPLFTTICSINIK